MTDTAPVSVEELQLAARNHGMPLEALRYDLTPVGLHYLLIHYDIPAVDAAGWRLTIDGAVRASLTVTLDELRARQVLSQVVTMECAGNGRARLDPRPVSQPWLLEAVGNAEWSGTSLAALLDEAEVERDAVEVLFTGLDRGVEGGGQQAYQRSRRRFLRPGRCRIEGRAWSGAAPVEEVAVSADGGSTWSPARLEPAAGRFSWCRWEWTWEAPPGEHQLCCRARDGAGNVQPHHQF